MSADTAGAGLRAAAARVVDTVVVGGRSLDAALARHEQGIAPGERPLLRHLCYGAVRFHWRLSAQVAAFLDRPLKARDSEIHALLVVGVFQLTDTRVSDHAAVSLTVEATRLLRRPKLKGLVNAILRNFLREPPALDDADDEVRFDHPQWMIDRLRQDWPEHWSQMLAANNTQAPMWLRVNARDGTAVDYRRRLAAELGRDETAIGTLLPGIDAGIRLVTALDVDALPGFADGAVSVQDGAAQLAAPWLSRAGQRRVLDACAAPGGKTAHLLELAAPDVTLTAVDSDPARSARVTETLDRLRLEATVLTADASEPKGWWDGEPFDAVLIDAPCSASGVIRRHPDIKHNRRQSDLATLAETQSALLEALWPLLAPGGRLLYVTCSVFAVENEAVIGRFLEAQPDAVEKHVLQNNNIQALMTPRPHGFQVLPGTEGLDGFYFACLEKPA